MMKRMPPSARQWAEGTVCIRMKIDMTSGNPCMWDPVAYRVKFHPHVRTGIVGVVFFFVCSKRLMGQVQEIREELLCVLKSRTTASVLHHSLLHFWDDYRQVTPGVSTPHTISRTA